MMKSIKMWGALCLSFLLTACGSLPDQLATTNENVVAQYQPVVDASDGIEVRLGGVIDTVTNLASRTRIEIVNLPIDKYGKPDIDQEPNGRFIAYVDGFVDPVTYSRGRLITVGGKKAGVERGKVGEFEADFPVINAYGQYLWRVEERLIINRHNSSFNSCWGYYCDDFYYGPTQGRVVKEVK
ncbi:starvation-inducible protein [Vibrio sp. 10N.286.49.C2]|uniref:Slp family lipoprotein n=1 Tax=unclassified Vibrio TaxID=2614977 RepID=UPI000C85C1C1|nr:MULTISPECIES: Slp family lipoprotein [unclassified Vibrio]PMH38922.1 starvation-inducible protein [Vibrio sp. 10N.286.49.C2]PMH55396.1 starvation-inducible protein [Vibrio sp. 10N.286.49.B1]PMH80879.1 starvation-inducible protein [Vibrio sp. 10N.286.48.B7]